MARDKNTEKRSISVRKGRWQEWGAEAARLTGALGRPFSISELIDNAVAQAIASYGRGDDRQGKGAALVSERCSGEDDREGPDALGSPHGTRRKSNRASGTSGALGMGTGMGGTTVGADEPQARTDAPEGTRPQPALVSARRGPAKTGCLKETPEQAVGAHEQGAADASSQRPGRSGERLLVAEEPVAPSDLGPCAKCDQPATREHWPYCSKECAK